MSVKSPTSDEVLSKFINKTPAGKLEKKFGQSGVKFEKGNIDLGESIETVVKSAAFFFRSEVASQPLSQTAQEEEVDLKKLSKIKFYQFPKVVNQDNWKGKGNVPMFNTIAGSSCSKCKAVLKPAGPAPIMATSTLCKCEECIVMFILLCQEIKFISKQIMN